MKQSRNNSLSSFDKVGALSLVAEAIVTPFYNLCEYHNIVDLAEKTQSQSLEFVWLQSLKALSEKEGSSQAQEKITEVLKNAVALKVSSLEFIQENDFLSFKYCFDESIEIEEESVEAFKINYAEFGAVYQLSVQFPTHWSLALNKKASLEAKISLMQALIKDSISSQNLVTGYHASKSNSFFVQRDKIDPITFLPICKEHINLANLKSSNLDFLSSVIGSCSKDSQIINSLLSSPSFSAYEKTRIIVPQIIAQTKFSILKKPDFEQLAALEVHLLGERMRKKLK